MGSLFVKVAMKAGYAAGAYLATPGKVAGLTKVAAVAGKTAIVTGKVIGGVLGGMIAGHIFFGF